MTNQDLQIQLSKLPLDAEVKIRIELTTRFETGTKTVGYRPEDNEVVITNE